MSSELNEQQNASVGLTVGCIEVLMMQPFNYAKNMSQQRRPISLNPSVMYRGVAANCANMGSCTMIQFAVGGKLMSMVTGGEQRPLTALEEMSTGVGAGSVSALAGSPLELVMIQQQRKGGGAVSKIKDLLQHPTNFTRGFLGTVIREGLWTCGYLSIPPVVRRNLMDAYPETFDTDDKARVPAALAGGFFGCFMTQPADTVKTCMQGDIERELYGTFSQTTKKIMGESGILGFYRGVEFRYGRAVCGVFIIDFLRDRVSKLLYPNAFA